MLSMISFVYIFKGWVYAYIGLTFFSWKNAFRVTLVFGQNAKRVSYPFKTIFILFKKIPSHL